MTSTTDNCRPHIKSMESLRNRLERFKIESNEKKKVMEKKYIYLEAEETKHRENKMTEHKKKVEKEQAEYEDLQYKRMKERLICQEMSIQSQDRIKKNKAKLDKQFEREEKERKKNIERKLRDKEAATKIKIEALQARMAKIRESRKNELNLRRH